MEEVVAKRHNSAGAGYIFVILMGIALIVAGILVGKEEEGALYIGIVIGGIILAMGIYYTVRFFMIPVKAIVYKDGLLYFPGKVVCKPEELDHVLIKVYRNGRFGAVSRYGKMEVTVHGRVYKYNDIADIKEAQERLLQLNREAIDRLSRPAEVQPENVAETAPSADPFEGIGSEEK